MIRPDLRRREPGDRQFLGTVMKENDLKAVAGILRADEMSQCKGYFLCRRETVFAVEIIECEQSSMTTVAHDEL